MRSEIYRNLRTGTWSRREDGLVVDHPEVVELRDVEFRVRPGGRDRVRDEERKNVHAFVIGNVLGGQLPDLPWREAYYNPYTCDTFIDKETRAPLKFTKYARLDSEMRVWYLWEQEELPHD